HIDIDAPLEPKGCIRVESMPFGSLPDRDRIEVGAFQENGGGMFGNPGMDAPEYPCYAHGPFTVTYHKVFRVKLAVHLVQGPEFGACGQGLDLDLVALDLRSVKCMEGLPKFVQYIIGHIDHIVDGGVADGQQSVLEPIRGFLDDKVAYGETAVHWCQFAVQNGYIDFKGTVVNG